MPAQDCYCCLSKPETLLQAHQPQRAHMQPQTQARLVTLAAAHHAFLHPNHGKGGSWSQGHLQGHHRDLAKLRGAHPQPLEALRAHTMWTKIDPG